MTTTVALLPNSNEPRVQCENEVNSEQIPSTKLSLEICVEDTGIGIKPENLAQVAKPFQQIRTAHSQQRGSGLGNYNV
jgi:signal transduction histidine kinase